MLRKKGHGASSSEPIVASPLSNFTVRFTNRDITDEYVDITQDVDESAIPYKPNPPSSLSGQSTPVNISTGKLIQGKDHSGPPSPIASPVAERVSSFRDNFHNLKERFTSHRKNSEDDKEKLLPSVSSESAYGTSHSSGSHSPSLIGKLVRKLEERRGSSHKDAPVGSLSPTKEPSAENGGAPAILPVVQPVGEPKIFHETVVKSGSMDNIPKSLKSAHGHDNALETASIASEPAVHEVTSLESQEFIAPEPRKGVAGVQSERPLVDTESASTGYTETVSLKEHGGKFGGVVGANVRGTDEKSGDGLSSMSSISPLLIVAGILVAVVLVPMPSFMSGLLFGCIITATASIRIWFTVLFPNSRKYDSYQRIIPGAPSIVTGDSTVRSCVNENAGRTSTEAESTWMNQMVGDFDISTFHVNQTQSVYVTLEGTALRIRKPKTRVVARRAMFDEELRSETFTFVESRVYNIQGAAVSLAPTDLPRKRRWLWRFPIAIKLVDPASLATLIDEARDFEAKKAEKDKEKSRDPEKEEEKLAPAKAAGEKNYFCLYLLPRSDREKEDWFWKLCAATGQYKFPLLRPNLSPNLSTLNLLFHRIFFDVLTESTWAAVVKKKIQKKLSVISLPYYIEELQITDIDLGKHLPIISDVSQKPGIDSRGVWVEMNFEYHGTVQMTLSTKLNLMKLKKDKDGDQDYRAAGNDHEVQMDTLSIGSASSVDAYRPQHRERGQSDREANMYESDEEDEFDDSAAVPPEGGGGSKIMRYVERITESKAFQKLTDVKIVRRAMENVSETDLTLTVVVERLAGRLALNVPHPPSDKLWYGFVAKPDLHLRAFPKFGEREVTFDQVTNWIERKLTTEFHRLITVPNMDDLTVPVMNSGLDDHEFRMSKLSDLILK
ncbi:uncharacterized protein LOC129585038 isoform X2 [Paramacrobiotus metropolitanus]|nr:uncharacterized protein LOC129585038 isoform X2 [Paramacrobiotus metropolitanus]XP_055333528.1 uncharacterized protein LOC129585038 isoform X2 [Paramacrobiotus metropolitanus]